MSASWYDVTHDDDFWRIAILKRPLNFFFLAYSSVIYQNLLHRRDYIAVRSWKLLLHQFCEKPLHITFKTVWHAQLLQGCWVFSKYARSDLIPSTGIKGGAVVQRVERWSLRSVGRGFKYYSRQHCVTTLGSLFRPMCLRHQAVLTWYWPSGGDALWLGR